MNVLLFLILLVLLAAFFPACFVGLIGGSGLALSRLADAPIGVLLFLVGLVVVLVLLEKKG